MAKNKKSKGTKKKGKASTENNKVAASIKNNEIAASSSQSSSTEINDDGIPADFKLVKQGAEAKIYVGCYLDRYMLIKERFKKKYRHPVLDVAITKERVKTEARSIVRSKLAGVRTPCIYMVDLDRSLIYMEYFTNSITVKDYLCRFLKLRKNKVSVEDNVLIMAITRLIGVNLQRLHQQNVIHGDLTTSNMMIVPLFPEKKIDLHDADQLELAFIDFGLSSISPSAEDKAVDIYVLERAVKSTHNNIPEFFKYILQHYTNPSLVESKKVLDKLDEVRARGRKRTMVG